MDQGIRTDKRWEWLDDRVERKSSEKNVTGRRWRGGQVGGRERYPALGTARD